MKTRSTYRVARWPGRYGWLFCALLYGSTACESPAVIAAQDNLLFAAPPKPIVRDEILLVSTRAIGTACDSGSMQRGLKCIRLSANSAGTSTWEPADWRPLICSPSNLPTIVYVHGNRVAVGKDIAQGMQVYRSLRAHTQPAGPVRFVIWSWPSEPIPGPIKDYVVKAQRTNPAAWQLAWVLDKMPAKAEISLVGYSYGSRVVSGAAHLLAGGRLGPLVLTKRTHSRRLPVRAALLAAAYDSDWLQPQRFYGRAMAEFDRLIIATNELDPAMRFYHFSNGRGRKHALGKSGVYQPATLGEAQQRLRCIDFTHSVRRSHSLVDYLSAEGRMGMLWQQLLMPPQPLLARTHYAFQLGDAQSGRFARNERFD